MEGIEERLPAIVLCSTLRASSPCVILSFMHADAIPGTEKGVLWKTVKARLMVDIGEALSDICQAIKIRA